MKSKDLMHEITGFNATENLTIFFTFLTLHFFLQKTLLQIQLGTLIYTLTDTGMLNL